MHNERRAGRKGHEEEEEEEGAVPVIINTSGLFVCTYLFDVIIRLLNISEAF